MAQSIPGRVERRDLSEPMGPVRLRLGATGALGALGASGALGAEPSTEYPAPGTAETIKPMMPLGQFRDTFIIAVDADGIAIIDQHVAHERVLFERVMEQLSSGPLESQRLLEPLLVELSPEGRQALLSHGDGPRRVSGLAVDDFGGETLRITALPAVLGREEAVTAIRALAEDLDGLDRGTEGRRCAAPDCRHHGLSCGREGQLPADAREDAAHSRRAAPHGVFDGVPARPSGDAAPHAARNRKELPADMSPRTGAALWYLGRFLQIFAMWILLVDIFYGRPDGTGAEAVLRRHRHVHGRLGAD